MKTAIIGLANSGKTTIFNALTGLNLEVTTFPTQAGDPHTGVVKVPDARITRLAEIFRPRKTTHATVEYIDHLGLTKGDQEQNRKVFDLIRDADAIVHVVRAFADETIVHPLGSVNPRRDAETVEMEMIFGDLDSPITLSSSEALAAGIPGARRVLIEGTAHMLNMEQPEVFNRIVLEFLNGV